MKPVRKLIKSFIDIIDEQLPLQDSVPYLPFCHTTTEGFASGMIDDNHAEPQICPEYNEDLLYFFYGKAVYLVEDKATVYTDNPPITFLFDHNLLGGHTIKRVLPFDSGGFSYYRFKTGYKREKYTYNGPALEKIFALLQLIYGNHDNYLDEKVDFENLKKYTEVCLAISELLRVYQNVHQGIVPTGPHVFSIEVQFNTQIIFEPTHIILSYDTYQKPFWRDTFRKAFPGIAVEYYGKKEVLESSGKPLEGAVYQNLMRNKVKTIMKKIINLKKSA